MSRFIVKGLRVESHEYDYDTDTMQDNLQEVLSMYGGFENVGAEVQIDPEEGVFVANIDLEHEWYGADDLDVVAVQVTDAFDGTDCEILDGFEVEEKLD